MSDDATLSAFRLADSFLPDGSHTASYGLEQFAQADRVTDADDLEALLETYLRRQVGPADLVALRAAHAGADDGDLDAVLRADRRLAATTLAAEFRESATAAGERLLELQCEAREAPLLGRYADRVDAGDAPGSHPAVLGAATAVAGVEPREACLLCCHAFVTGLLGAAQRLLALGHTDAQRVLVDLRPAMRTAVDDSAGRTLDDMTPFAPLVDVLAAEHERADRRLFVS
ncbi:urease accessory protein UreF [Haloglomus halophilum]|uniref:urease accessory protein UreF n=1 Tax=Haloglomus halophilum TaxID=2962672 RepID=UPI0020C9A67D|nr:urease accessory UreF family protein [Haloglomus halophilum]